MFILCLHHLQKILLRLLFLKFGFCLYNRNLMEALKDILKAISNE